MQDAVCGVSRACRRSSEYFTDGGPALVAVTEYFSPLLPLSDTTFSTRACISRDGFVRVFL
jgi:hypothetical protein